MNVYSRKQYYNEKCSFVFGPSNIPFDEDIFGIYNYGASANTGDAALSR